MSVELWHLIVGGWCLYLFGFLTCSLFAVNQRMPDRPLSDEELRALAECMDGDAKFFAGCQYGDLMGYERGYRDAQAGRVA